METISFEKHTGKKTEINIVEEKRINSGGYGKIYDALVDMGEHAISKDKILKRFIIKKYYKSGYHIKPKEQVRHASKNYSLAKQAGLKVFPTFRVGDDKESILMTSGFSKDQICIGSNNSNVTIENFDREPINQIENLDKFLDSYFTEGVTAAKKGLKFWPDLAFFIVSKEEPTKLDFVLGDLDNLEQTLPHKYTAKINVDHLKKMLIEFFKQNTHPDYTQNFIDKVNAHHQKVLQDIDNTNF